MGVLCVQQHIRQVNLMIKRLLATQVALSGCPSGGTHTPIQSPSWATALGLRAVPSGRQQCEPGRYASGEP